MFALTHCTIYTGTEVLTNHALVVDGQQIKQLCLLEELDSSITRYDLKGANLSPGFIDLQLNGCGGVMFNDEINIEALATMHQANLTSGCTSFLPTLITCSDEDMQAAIAVQRQFQQANPEQSLGLHLEGPYLNVERKGIHNPDFIRQADQAMIDTICANHDVIAKVTLAPEQNDPAHIHQLRDAGIVVSIGHTAASYQQAIEGFAAGISFATHLFNAMSPLLGREPGVIGAIYDSPSIYAGIIVDGLHVDYANVRIAHRLKGNRLVLVTDATAPAGADIEQFNFVGQTVYYRDGKCVDEHGTLGGSALTMIKAVQNTVQQVRLPLDEALRMATLYPARAIGVADKLGAVKAGLLANLCIFDDKFNILATVSGGVYQASDNIEING